REPFKFPFVLDNPHPSHVEWIEESSERIESEKAVYRVLMQHRRPNIVDGILIASEGIFMRRENMTLETRLQASSSVAPNKQVQWIRQLASALAWIEQLGYVHGDVRPENILLDTNENIRLGDFDAAVKIGDQVAVASEPYIRLGENYELPIAGPASEQYALASCMYYIRFGHIPYHELEPQARGRRLDRGDFPSTAPDAVFGGLIQDCWNGCYGSMRLVEQKIAALMRDHGVVQDSFLGQTERTTDDLLYALRAECEVYLAKERSSNARD
ncbi:hypothetical protein M011DRAFT_413925, partial [Sporormia fimetaria CBS 119925]